MAMTKTELEAMTKEELVAYANENEIMVQHSWLKDEIVSEIMKGEKAAAAKGTAKAADKTDSVKHLEERKAKIEAENDKNKADKDTFAENQEIAQFQGLPKEGETREQLLDRIRAMRKAPAEATPDAPPRNESLQKAFELEQEAGKAAVAKAEAFVAQHSGKNIQEAAAGEKK